MNLGGETIDRCKLLCNNERSTNFCSPSDCNLRCDTCSNSLCKWNVSEIRKQNTLRPDTCSIKGFSGKNTIKLTWVKPDSSFDILKYYIIVTNSDVNEPDFLQIHNIEDARNLLDYYIVNLKNDIIYNVFIISKNKHGVSDKSNVISIIPKEDGDDFSIKKKIVSVIHYKIIIICQNHNIKNNYHYLRNKWFTMILKIY